jgi:hypothetical protein
MYVCNDLGSEAVWKVQNPVAGYWSSQVYNDLVHRLLWKGQVSNNLNILCGRGKKSND